MLVLGDDTTSLTRFSMSVLIFFLAEELFEWFLGEDTPKHTKKDKRRRSAIKNLQKILHFLRKYRFIDLIEYLNIKQIFFEINCYL